MKDKVCLLTGATLGIGKEAAIGIAKLGAKLVIVGRDAKRTQETAEEVKKETGNPNVDFIVADLSSLAEVRRTASEFKKKHNRLDVLINNAGAVFTKRETSVDGYEKTWALNHLAYFLLTSELLDLLKASAPSRIVSVASEAHTMGGINFEDLFGEKKYKGFRIYGQSKLANILFTYALARRLKGTGVTANCLHPGVVATGFGKNTPGLLKFVWTLFKPFLITAKKGALTTIYLASSPEVEGVSGKYFSKCKELGSSTASYDEGTQEKLWAITQQQVAR